MEKIKSPNFKGKKVLITGGAGFIGSHLADELLGRGAIVTIYDNFMRGEENKRNIQEVLKAHINKPKIVVADVLNFGKLKPYVQKSDFCFHLAALPSNRLALSQPRWYAEVDVMGTINVLEAARLTKDPPKVILASSNKVYGKQKPPFKEELIPQPEGPYGQAKKTSEEFCQQYSKYYLIDTPIARFHHVIGPRCQPDLVLSIFTERIICGQKPIVHGQFRGKKFIPCAADWTNIKDTISGLLLISALKGFQVFNLGTGKTHNLLELAEEIMKGLGKKTRIIKKQMLPHETLVHCADISKAKKKLGFIAKISFEQSIKEFIEWRFKVGPRKQAVYKIRL
jgi:nucleoside-diphosphate-sugar epimerase